MAAKKIATGGVLAACALIFSYIEYLLQINVGVPGIKLGIANVVIIVALYKLGAGYAFVINLTRIMIAGLLFTGLFGMLFGLAGGGVSILTMVLFKHMKGFGVVGVSVAGGVAHNMGQLSAAAFLITDFTVLYYLPVLLVSGALTGLFVGFLSQIFIIRTKSV